MQKVALITGINGQDGSYLSEFLLDHGYDVHGLVRRSSQFNRSRIEETRTQAQKRGAVFELHYGELIDSSSLYRVLMRVKPAEIYNLAAESHVGISFDQPEYVTEVNANGVLRLLECIRHIGIECKFYQASSSELFGKSTAPVQNEQTPFYPISPYGVSKLYAYWIIKNYREYYSMHACNGILFNHESPRRGENFVTRKITYSLARIKYGLQEELHLGNINCRRDWGFARDYIKAMWSMIQQSKPDDYVIATGETHSVKDFIILAGQHAGIELEFEGEGVKEIGRDKKTGKIVVRIDPKFYRPADIIEACGDSSKAYSHFGWKPETSFQELVKLMVDADMAYVSGSL